LNVLKKKTTNHHDMCIELEFLVARMKIAQLVTEEMAMAGGEEPEG